MWPLVRLDGHTKNTTYITNVRHGLRVYIHICYTNSDNVAHVFNSLVIAYADHVFVI